MVSLAQAILGVFGGILSPNTLMLGAGIGLIILLIYWKYIRPMRRARTGETPVGMGDLIAIVFDEDANEIKELRFVKIGANSYVHVGPFGPLFLEVTPGTKIYRCRNRMPCVPAEIHGIMAVPVDTELASATHLLFNTEELANVREEDAIKLMKVLYERMEERIGHVPVEGPSKVAFAFNIPKIIHRIMGIFATQGGALILHFLQTMADVAAQERYLQALGAYMQKKYTWLWYIILLVIAFGIAAAMIQAMGGVGGKP